MTEHESILKCIVGDGVFLHLNKEGDIYSSKNPSKCSRLFVERLLIDGFSSQTAVDALENKTEIAIEYIKWSMKYGG